MGFAAGCDGVPTTGGGQPSPRCTSVLAVGSAEAGALSNVQEGPASQSGEALDLRSNMEPGPPKEIQSVMTARRVRRHKKKEPGVGVLPTFFVLVKGVGTSGPSLFTRALANTGAQMLLRTSLLVDELYLSMRPAELSLQGVSG